MKQRLATHVTLDGRDRKIYIEGVEMPFFVGEDIDVENFDGLVGGVRLTLYADVIEMVGVKGETSTYRSFKADQAELEWARREARRIVYEGMVDVLEWLWASAREQALKDFPVRHLEGLVDEDLRKQLVSKTSHSESGQQKGEQA